jgi:hypothetical protein
MPLNKGSWASSTVLRKAVRLREAGLRASKWYQLRLDDARYVFATRVSPYQISRASPSSIATGSVFFDPNSRSLMATVTENQTTARINDKGFTVLFEAKNPTIECV